MKIKNELSTFLESRIVMAPSGELLIALEIAAHTDVDKAFEVKIESSHVISMSFVEPLGYLIYHPEIAGGFSIFMNTLDSFEDLGKIN